MKANNFLEELERVEQVAIGRCIDRVGNLRHHNLTSSMNDREKQLWNVCIDYVIDALVEKDFEEQT